MSVCKVCEGPLVVPVDSDDADQPGPSHEQTVPDDLQLRCGCHFHWQCLMDQSSEVVVSLKCPSCAADLASNHDGSSSTTSVLGLPEGASILARYVNEGGTQDNLDILPSIAEEAYLETHPEARPARALHVMCTEGDVLGIVELLQDVSDEIEDMGAFICYQDPLADLNSGLHLAIEHAQEEVAWLLLWLSSSVPDSAFPDLVHQSAKSIGANRLQVNSENDIRSLQDAQGLTALGLAQQLQWSGNGLLSALSV